MKAVDGAGVSGATQLNGRDYEIKDRSDLGVYKGREYGSKTGRWAIQLELLTKVLGRSVPDCGWIGWCAARKRRVSLDWEGARIATGQAHQEAADERSDEDEEGS